MKILCKKNCYMENTGERCFTRGKSYTVVGEHELWYSVFDDQEDPHDVPKKSFFKEYFSKYPKKARIYKRKEGR